MKVGPVKRLPKLPCDGAFRVIAVATQVAEVDATAQHKDRDEQRGKELPLGRTGQPAGGNGSDYRPKLALGHF
jgi:hypothetical protein